MLKIKAKIKNVKGVNKMWIAIIIYTIWVLSGLVPLMVTMWLEWNFHEEELTLEDILLLFICFVAGLVIGIAAIYLYFQEYIDVETVIIPKKIKPTSPEPREDEDNGGAD